MKIQDADKFKGQIHREGVVRRSAVFQKSYRGVKVVVSTLIAYGKVDTFNLDMKKEHEEAIIKAFPPIIRSGMFYHVWEIL